VDTPLEARTFDVRMTASAAPSIQVTVHFFARYAEVVGREQVQCALPRGGTVGDLVAVIRQKVPRAAALPERPLCAVNLRHVLPEHPLGNGDTVAILPPLAGG